MLKHHLATIRIINQIYVQFTIQKRRGAVKQMGKNV